MSTRCRLIQGNLCEITQIYSKGVHDGIDIVNKGYTLGNIIAHSDGVVVGYRDDCNGFEKGSYGNYIKLKHDNGMYTLYAHMEYKTVLPSLGSKVKKGDVLGYMGNTGYSFGGHLHFEVRDTNDNKIDPTGYLNKDLPNETVTPSYDYQVGDAVEITGVYVSSTSEEKLIPKFNHGIITRIVSGSRNPYLLNDGFIGWVNKDVIKGLYADKDLLLLVKRTIRGDYGNGEARKKALGEYYEAVQHQVNLNYQNGTTNYNNIRIY